MFVEYAEWDLLSSIHHVRAVMRAYGDVQRVGYRFVVQDLARKMGVKGYVRNLSDGSVEIVAEASKEVVEKFVDAVKFREPPIDVVRLDLVYAEATGEYEHFSLVSGDLTEEIIEGFGTGLKYVNLSREETKQGFSRVEGSITAMHADLKTMHTDLKGSVEEMRKDLKGSIVEMHTDLKDSITTMGTDLKGSVTAMREDLKGSIEETGKDLKGSIQDMHKDLGNGIKAMHTDLKGGIDSMHGDMNERFEEMAKRYDAISSELIRTREELTRAVDNMSRLVDEFIRRRKKR